MKIKHLLFGEFTKISRGLGTIANSDVSYCNLNNKMNWTWAVGKRGAKKSNVCHNYVTEVMSLFICVTFATAILMTLVPDVFDTI